MKRWMILAAAVLLAAQAQAVLLPAETGEMAISGSFDFETEADSRVEAKFFFGYFFVDYMETGIGFTIRDDDNYMAWGIGPEVEYNFDFGVELVPFLGGYIQYAEIDSDLSGTKDSAAIFGVKLGLKYFFTEYLALATSLDLESATDDIFPAGKDGELENFNARLVWGMRFFF